MKYKFDESHLENIWDKQKKEFEDSLNNKTSIDVTPRFYTCNKKDDLLKESDIQAISLFSGCGGLDIGAQLAGVKVISSLDFYEDSVETLKINKCFNDAEHLCKDINEVNGSDYENIIKKNNPKKLILIGGPPCQPFSKAGYWRTNEKRKAYDDPRNMIGQYLRLIKEINPDGFLLENVDSILHPSNKVAVDIILDSAKEMGYNVVMYSVNAADYGIPQKRKRVFFLASKNKIEKDVFPTHGSDKDCAVNKNLLPYERVIDWIGKYDRDEYFNDKMDAYGLHYEDLICVPPGKNYIALSSREKHPSPRFEAGKRYWTYLLKLHPLQPSWTIIAEPGHWEGPFHWNNRRLSIREAAAIQTFPEDYKFYGGIRSQRKQIGNAVPPLLAKIMIESLVRWL